MIQEPAVELAIGQGSSICCLVELRPNRSTQNGPRARMVVARLSSQPASFQALRQAGHELLRQLVSATLADQSPDVRLTHSTSGSPLLVLNGELSRLSVSVAHSEQWLAAGLAQDSAIGVDIEVNSRRRSAPALAEWLAWPGSECGADEFVRHWVLWEACAKCTQQSILKKQNPGFTALQSPLSEQCSGTMGQWSGWRDHFNNEAHFAMALLTESGGRLQHHKLDPERLTPWGISGVC